MKAARVIWTMGVLTVLPGAAAQVVEPDARSAPGVPVPIVGLDRDDPALPNDPLHGAVPLTCSGDFFTDDLVAQAPTCEEAEEALVQPITDAAHDFCSPAAACNIGISYKWVGFSGGLCTVRGGARFGCIGGGGGGSGGGGGPIDP